MKTKHMIYMDENIGAYWKGQKRKMIDREGAEATAVA